MKEFNESADTSLGLKSSKQNCHLQFKTFQDLVKACDLQRKVLRGVGGTLCSPTSVTHLRADALGEPGCGESWQAGFSLREGEGSMAGGSFPGHKETTRAQSWP